MDAQIFPSDISEWSWETIESLSEQAHDENQHIEYKSCLTYPKEEDNEKSPSEWRHDIEKEFVGFANSSGGIIIFGMGDSAQPVLFEPPEHEVTQAVTQFIANSQPRVQTEISEPITPPGDVKRMMVAVRVYESPRKPVKTSQSAFFVRINDQTQPMTWDQIQMQFVEADRRQQAIRLLEIEFDRFQSIFEEFLGDYRLDAKTEPGFQAINTDAVRDALRENTHLYTNPETSEIVQAMLDALEEIDNFEYLYKRDYHYASNFDFNYNMMMRRNFYGNVVRLNGLINMLRQKLDI